MGGRRTRLLGQALIRPGGVLICGHTVCLTVTDRSQPTYRSTYANRLIDAPMAVGPGWLAEPNGQRRMFWEELEARKNVMIPNEDSAGKHLVWPAGNRRLPQRVTA
jgi:hypothetical protein